VRRLHILTLAGALALSRVVAGAVVSTAVGADLADTLSRVGERVEAYYSRARSIVCTETVVLQPLTYDLAADGFARRLVYELRVEWEPPGPGETSGEAHVVRELLSVNGRRPGPKDEPKCTDPKPVSPEPLAMLLPSRQSEFVFKPAGGGRTAGRASLSFDYQAAGTPPATVSWKDECVSVDVPAKTKGRVWVDAATGDVLRLDEHLSGMFDFAVPREHQRDWHVGSMTLERADSSTQYKPVKFAEPDETVLLPASIESVWIFRTPNGASRTRRSQTFSSYRRFTTGGRIVQ